MATITIIVPVYKAEKFIRHTIHSVKEQTFTDWELILVIDGSPDDSAGICKEIAANDKRIRVLEQENLGVNRARQNGLHHCTTPFITFLDSDDSLPPHALDVMYAEIKKGYDVVKGVVAINVAPERKTKEEYHAKLLDRQQFLEGIYLGEIDPYMCGSIYRRDLLDDYIFQLCIDNQLSIGEDWITNLYVGKKIKTACVVNECTYVYTENANGVMNTSVMSQSYGKRVKLVVDAIMNYNTPRWLYLKELNAALHINELFIWERGYSHQEYKQINGFVKKYGKDELRNRCDSRYLYFINCEPLYYIYSRIYSITKKVVKDRTKRKIIY